MTIITGYDAIEAAHEYGLRLNKYADPTEGARERLDTYQAREIAMEDPSLIWINAAWSVADENNGAFGDTYETEEEAEAARKKCIEDGVAAELAEGEVTLEEARAKGERFFSVVMVDDGDPTPVTDALDD